MSETGGASVAPKKGLTLDDLIAAIDRHERNPSNIPKVDTFHFCGERVSEWLERVEQALVGRSDVVKFQLILQYVFHSYHQEVKKVIDAAQGSWERFKEGMQRKYCLGDGLLTTTDLEAINKEDFTTIGAFVQEFKKRARKIYGISEEAQCAIFLRLLTTSEAVELTRHGGGSIKLTWATIDRGVEVGCLDQVEQRQVRLQRQKKKERDATASGTPGVTRIVTDVLAQLGYVTEPVVQRRVVTAVNVKGKESVIEEAVQEELWEEEEPVPQHLTKVQRKVRNLAQGGQGSGKAQVPQAQAAAPLFVAAPSSSTGPSKGGAPSYGQWPWPVINAIVPWGSPPPVAAPQTSMPPPIYPAAQAQLVAPPPSPDPSSQGSVVGGGNQGQGNQGNRGRGRGRNGGGRGRQWNGQGQGYQGQGSQGQGYQGQRSQGQGYQGQGYHGQGYRGQGDQGSQGYERPRFDWKTAICQHCDQQGHTIRFCNIRQEDERSGLISSTMDGNIYDQFGEVIDRRLGGVRAEAQRRAAAGPPPPAMFRLWQEKEEPPIGVEEVGSDEEVTQGLRGGSETEEAIIIESDDEDKEERTEPLSVLFEKMEDLLDKMGRYQQKLVGLCEEVKGWRSNIPTVFLYDSGPESAPGRPEVNVVGSCPQSGMRGRPLTPQARMAQAARTRNQAKASASQEPPRREPKPGRRKEVVEVENDDDEEEEDERLRREEDQRVEQRARKKGTRGEAEPVIHDGPPKKKKYVVWLEEGFDVEKVIDRLLEGHNDLMTLKEILASAPRLRDELKGRLSRRLVPNVHLGMILPKEAEWAESGTKMDWKCVACGTVDLMVKGSKCAAMVDTGTEMNIIREADAIRFGLDIDRSDCGILHGAICKAVFCGTASNVLVEVGKVKVRACFFIMPDVDHGILLGRSFLSRTETVMFNKHDLTLILLLCDPACGNYKIITCRNTGPRSIRNRPNPGSFAIEESEGERRRLWAEPEAGERVEAFSLSLSDVGKAMDLVAAHEMADPDAIQALREQVLECPEAGRAFVKNFAAKTEHLRKLVRQDQEWVWGEEQEEVVAKMKKEFREGGLVLGAPDYDATETRPLIVETDAGPTALGGVLIQADMEGKERPLRFESRTLCTTERNYSQFKRETLAVLHFLQIFRNYIFGRRFISRVDPTALTYSLRNYVPSDPTVARWLTYIWMFNFELKRIPGSKNWADRLSRINWDKQEGEAVENTPPVDGFLDQEEDVRLHINKWSPRVPSCVGYPIWQAPKGYERRNELVLKPFDEEDPWGGKDVQWMMELALASSHSLVEDMRTIEEGPGQVERHEDLMGGMYLLVNTLLQEGLDQSGSLNSTGNVDKVPESQDDEFEEGEIKEAFRAEEYDGIYLELGLLLSCEVRLRDASDRAQRMLQHYLLFLDNFWDHARRMGWTMAQTIEGLRGVGRFEEPVARIRREATTRSEVEWRMQELRPSPVGPDGRLIRLEIGNMADFILAFEWFMQGQGIPRDEWARTLPLWTRKAERPLASQIRDMARDWESCRAHLREAFRRPEPPQPRVERRQRSQRSRNPEPREVRPSRGGQKALARREEEPEREPEVEERGAYPECGLGLVEFHRFIEGGLRRSPAHTREEPPVSEGPLRELETHLDISQWRASPQDEKHEERVEGVPREEVPQEEVPREEVPREEVPREEVPREEVPREEAQGTQRESRMGDVGRRAGKEVIEVGEDTPPQASAVGLRLGDAPGSTRQAEERLRREEVPLPSSERAPSPEGRAGRRREMAVVRREALTLIDRHLAAYALEHPDLEETASAEPRQEPYQPEKEMEVEIPKRIDLRTRERAPAGETAEEKRARKTRGIDEIWQERQRLEAAGELPEQQQERQRSEAAGALPGQPPSAPARAPEIPEMWRDFWEQRGEELPSPVRVGFGVVRKAEERLDRKIKFLAKTNFDRHLLLEGDLTGKKMKEASHGVRLEAMEMEIQELGALVASQAAIIESLRQQTQGRVDMPESSRQGEQRQPGQPSAAEPRQEPPMGRVILEPEEARAQRQAGREAFEFKAPTELATLPIAAAGPVVPLAVEEGLPPSSSETAQGSAEGSMGVLLEAVHTM
ncbi:hypothetical protein CBR_g3672 [Chara braunii]|uniref:Reverse transcriptase RNase H-like domain-containing protein n=1 Tax=Chara braunii TaxID=69332 RepID=A0A388KG73_CHABU|nr:hypothetical protein CBR_g3672 [Chara braunii]|eukprot:GBG68973.1 hypothetical protein CBR_g3672 [Chara braunii]